MTDRIKQIKAMLEKDKGHSEYKHNLIKIATRIIEERLGYGCYGNRGGASIITYPKGRSAENKKVDISNSELMELLMYFIEGQSKTEALADLIAMVGVYRDYLKRNGYGLQLHDIDKEIEALKE